MKSLPDLYKRRHFTAKGYFAYPLSSNDTDVPDYQQWLAFDSILSEAKRGNFTRVPELTALIQESNDWVFVGQCMRLFGDAATGGALNDALQALPVGEDSVQEFAYAQAFVNWGHLRAIPALVDLYERYSFADDAMYVALGLSLLVEDEPGEVSAYPLDEGRDAVHAYCDRARRHYEGLCMRLGTREAVVFRGDVVGIQRICKKMLDDLGRRKGFHEEMRHKFEAYTGIDCSEFYVNGALQPLAVAAAVEGFLESREVDRYENGVRYFFGHRIPN